MSSGQKTTNIRQSLDVDALSKWMIRQEKLVGILGHKDIEIDHASDMKRRLSIRQFGFGQSNPTYLLSIVPCSATSTAAPIKMVLRKKPNKVAHKSAHALHREYHVLECIQRYNSQLQNDGDNEWDKSIPVPETMAYCTDQKVLGAEFYIMEFIQGRIFVDPSLPDMTKDERETAYKDVVKVLSNIHSIPIDEVGLGKYGKKGQYVSRQIKRLTLVAEQQSKTVGPIDGLDDMMKLLSMSAKQCPDNVGLIHGDFKIDNLIFHPTLPKVIGVLDWELSTIGDFNCDLANLCMMYYVPNIKEGWGIAGIEGMKLDGTGIPSRTELLELYCNFSSNVIDTESVMSWRGFYLSFLFFKNCVIVHGVWHRAKLGVASSAMANKVAMLLPRMVRATKLIWNEQPPPASTQVKSRL